MVLGISWRDNSSENQFLGYYLVMNSNQKTVLRRLAAIVVALLGLLLTSGCVNRPYVYSKAIDEIAGLKGASPVQQIAGITDVADSASKADAAQANRPHVIWGGYGYPGYYGGGYPHPQPGVIQVDGYQAPRRGRHPVHNTSSPPGTIQLDGY